MSLILTFLSLLASLFMYSDSFSWANALYIHDEYVSYGYYVQYSTNILPGFYCGLISFLFIFVKYSFHFKIKLYYY